MWRGVATLFRDMVTLALVGFVAIVIVMLPHLNPPGLDAAKAIEHPGQIMVEAVWKHGVDIDVDLWVLAPGDHSVGYSRKEGVVFDLLRDDLGMLNDTLPLNYENAFTRSRPPGEYIVNVMIYRVGPMDALPLKVIVKVSKKVGKSSVTLIQKAVTLRYHGEELTVVRFTLDEDGDASGFHDVPIKIYHNPSSTTTPVGSYP
jgi:hypothetical protein